MTFSLGTAANTATCACVSPRRLRALRSVLPKRCSSVSVSMYRILYLPDQMSSFRYISGRIGDAGRDEALGAQPAGIAVAAGPAPLVGLRSEEHTSELQSLMRNSYS